MAIFINEQKGYSIYSASTTYAVGDIVSYLGQLYKCKLISLANLPTNTTYWELLWTNENKT